MKRMVCRRAVLSLLVMTLTLAVCGAALFAAAVKKQITVRFDDADSKPTTANAKIRETVYTKIIVVDDDATFTSDKAVQRSEGNVHVFTCTGNPVFTDPENTITATTLVAHSTPRRAEFSGNVKMVSTPKQKPQKAGDAKKELVGEPSTMTCDKMSYDYTGKKALATGNVMIVQKERTVWADQAIYEEAKEMVYLTGNVRMKNTGKEEVKEMKDAESATISLESDWIYVKAKTGGKVEMLLEVDEAEPAPAAPAEPKK